MDTFPFDYDADGDIDFVVYDLANSDYSDVYINNGSGSFTLSTTLGISIPSFADTKLIIEDVDNDGDDDVLIATGQTTHAYYRHDGDTNNKPPIISSFTPVDNATGIDVNSNIVLNFDEVISSAGTGTIKIYKASDDSLVESITGNNVKVTGTGGTTITINPSTTLITNITYYIQIDKQTFFDTDGMTYNPLNKNDKTSMSFTTGSSNSTGSINLDFDDSSGAGGNDYYIGYNAGVTSVNISDADVSITDSDDTNMESGQISLSGGVVNGANETISIVGTPATMGGVTIAYTSGTVIDLSGSAILSDYQDVIEAVVYANSAAITAIIGGARTVTTKVNDGDIDTNTATTTITVVAAPQITSGTYDEDTKILVVTGVNFIANGSSDDVDVTKIILTGEASGTYTLTIATSNVEIDSATQFTVTLAGSDIVAVEALLNTNGTLSYTGSAYNINVGHGFITAYSDGDTSDATGNAITVSGVPSPSITSATYDYSTGNIVVTGVDFKPKSGAANDVTAASFIITGEGGSTYGLTDTLNVERDSVTQFTLGLSASDKAGVNAIINKGGTSATGGQVYNIEASDNFMAEILVGNTADATNAITVSNVTAPTITSALYDASTGVFSVTGANIPSVTGANNDIIAAKFTFMGANDTDIGAYPLVGSSNVERTSITSFSITLDVTDKAEIQKRINKAGLTSTGGITYNLSGDEDWAAGADAAVNVVDNTAVTVSNIPAPTITSATYNEDSKSLVVTGTNFVGLDGATNDIDITMLTLTGEAGATFTLTGQTANVEIDSATQFTLTVAGTDVTSVESLLNVNGTASNDSSTYNLNAADDFIAGYAVGDTSDSTNIVTVSGWPQPIITSSTYDAVTGLFVITGIDFTTNGGGLDVDVSTFTFTGEGGITYTLTDTADVNITNATTFTITLSATDKAAINDLFNKNGTDSTGTTAYNIAVADNFMTAVTAGDTSDTTNNAITTSNVAIPTVTSATYNAASGMLVVTGTSIPSLGSASDIDASMFTLLGEDSSSYTLVGSSDVERTSSTSFTIILDTNDKAAVNLFINKDGFTSTGGTTYNLGAAEDWAKGADASVNVIDGTNAITVSNVAAPTITSATYNSHSGVLTVTGAGLFSLSGTTNDIDLSTFTLTGEGGASYTLTTTTDVELSSNTSFSATLIGGDKAGVDAILHLNGTQSDDTTTYNLAAAEDWNMGVGSSINIIDSTNAVTVTGWPLPTISTATYDVSTGILVVSGTNFEAKTGSLNDIDVSLLTFSGQGGVSYSLTSTTDVEITSATEFSITLSGTDKTSVDALLNKNSTSASDATVYNLAAADDFNANKTAGDTSDSTGNSITVNKVAPAVTTPATTLNVNAATQAVSGTFTTDGTAISLFLDTGNDGTPDGGALGTDNVAGGTWSITATLADDTVFDYLIVADVGGGNESLYIDVPTIIEDSTAPVAPVVTAPAVAASTQSTSYTISGTHAENGVIINLYADTDNNGVADNATIITSGVVSSNAWSFSATLTADSANDRIVVAKDAVGNSSADTNVPTITHTTPIVVIPPTNTSPIISGSAPSTMEVGKTYNFIPSASDADAGDTLTFSISGKPSWATFSSATGALSGTPSKDDVGSSSMTITVTDNSGADNANASLVFALTVTAKANVAPVATDISATVEEDGETSISLSATDTDKDPLTLVVVNQPSHGSLVTSTQANTWLYTPNENYNGSDSFTYKANDGTVDSAVVTANITITPINDKPIAVDDVITQPFNNEGSYTLDVLGNDTDVDNDTLTIINASVDIGSVSVTSGQLLYQAGVAQGNATFSYVISDGTATAQASVSLTIEDIPLEGLPVITLPADIEVNATGLYTKVDLGVAKAVDSAGNPLPVSLLDGITVFAPGNNIAYWQSVDVNGSASIAMQKVVVHPLITLSKNEQSVEGTSHSVGVHLNGPSPTYPVTIAYTVGGTMDASDHNLTSGEVSIEQGTSTTINFDVLVDGLVEENETLTISLSNGAIYTLEVSEQNLAPTISYNVTQGGEQRSLIEIGGGDIVIQTQVNDGNPTDTHTYQWASSLVDTDSDETSFTIDSANLSAGMQTIDVSVTDSAEAPATTTANIYLNIQETLPILTSKDTDGDLIPDNEEGLGDADSDGIPDYLDVPSACNVMPEQASNSNAFLVEGEAGVCLRKGSTVANNKTGGIELSPDEVASDTQATNTGGLFDFIAYGLPKAGQTYSLVLPQVLPIPASAIYRKYTQSKGWFEFVVDANNSYSSTFGDKGYCPAPNDNGWTAGLTEGHWCVKITLEDGGPNDDDGEANGTIVDPGGVGVWLSSNSLPDAQNESTQTAWNTAITIDVLANDTDADNDTLTINSASADLGVVTIVNEQLIYTPPTDFFGVATINYGISDNNGGTGFAEVTVNVTENQAPIANDDLANTDDQTTITINVLENDSDGNGDELTITSANAEYGNAIINADNHITYTPKTGFDGVDTITYTINDGKDGQAQATVSITVTAYEIITVTNKSSGGGSMGYLSLLLGSLLIMRRNKKIAQSKQIRQWSVTVLSLCLLSFNSQANWHLDATLGQAKTKDTNTTLQSGTITAFDDSDTSWSLGGGYAFDNGIDVGVHYLDMGEGSATITGESLTPEQYHQAVSTLSPILVSGVGIEVGYQFWQEQNFSSSVFVGMLAWEGDIASEYNGHILKTEVDGTDVYYGIKGTYQLTSQWQLGLGFKRYNLAPNDVDNVYLSVNYQF